MNPVAPIWSCPTFWTFILLPIVAVVAFLFGWTPALKLLAVFIVLAIILKDG